MTDGCARCDFAAEMSDGTTFCAIRDQTVDGVVNCDFWQSETRRLDGDEEGLWHSARR